MRILGGLKWTAIVVAICALVYQAGPRVASDMTKTFDDGAMGPDPDRYLAGEESEFSDIRGGLQKQIVWADPATRARTAFAVVYIHGFSASAGEVRPLPDLVARALGANVYYTRLQGHGRTSANAMAEATLAGWTRDYAEAIAIGRRIGRRIVVISTSTGGSITTWGLAEPALGRDVAAAIFLSPNYGVKSPGEFLLRGPWAARLAHILLGPRTGFTPENDLHARLWTTNYPVEALIPMAQSVKLARDADVAAIKTPTLFIISSADKVVRPDRTKAIAAAWGGVHNLIDVGDIGTGSNHVIAGDALSPKMTAPLTGQIVAWLRGVGVQAE
jgi:alpha-beta hydrolase superfamily lysophospholipase